MGLNLTLLGLLVFRRRFAALEWLLRVSRPWWSMGVHRAIGVPRYRAWVLGQGRMRERRTGSMT